MGEPPPPRSAEKSWERCCMCCPHVDTWRYCMSPRVRSGFLFLCPGEPHPDQGTGMQRGPVPCQATDQELHLPGAALITPSPKVAQGPLRDPLRSPTLHRGGDPHLPQTPVGVKKCSHLCPHTALRVHEPGMICVPHPRNTLTCRGREVWLKSPHPWHLDHNSRLDQRVRVPSGTTLGGFL